MLEEQKIERDQVEAQLHVRIKDLQEEMDERESKSVGVEAILHRYLAKLEVELDTKKRELHDCEKVEDALRGQVKEQKKTILEMDRVASTLRAEVYELRQNLEERLCSRDRVEAILHRYLAKLEVELDTKKRELHDCEKVEDALRGQVKEQKKTILKMDRVASTLRAEVYELRQRLEERHCGRDRVEAILHRFLAKLEVELDTKKRDLHDCEKVEEALHGQAKKHKKTILEMDTVASTLRAEVDELRQTLEERHCRRHRVQPTQHGK
jgi:chromosome segregation ATPase